MKIQTANNAELIIKARNEEDFKAAQKVAALIEQNEDVEMVVCSECEYEFWIHMTACWDNYQASDIKEAYKTAKKQAA